jgi:hypothetical protein
VFDGRSDAGPGRQVNDQIDGVVLEHTAQKGVVTNVPTAKTEPRRHLWLVLQPPHVVLFERRRVEGVEVIQTGDALSRVTETGTEMRTDEASASSDQDMSSHVYP